MNLAPLLSFETWIHWDTFAKASWMMTSVWSKLTSKISRNRWILSLYISIIFEKNMIRAWAWSPVEICIFFIFHVFPGKKTYRNFYLFTRMRDVIMLVCCVTGRAGGAPSIRGSCPPWAAQSPLPHDGPGVQALRRPQHQHHQHLLREGAGAPSGRLCI